MPLTSAEIRNADLSTKLLFVSPVGQDQAALRHILRRTGPPIAAANCRKALRAIRQSPVPVVLCDSDLPDGSWVDILNQEADAGQRPLVIVTSRLADERLWAEVLNLGGFDVIAKPFRECEVPHVLTTAWLHAQEAVSAV